MSAPPGSNRRTLTDEEAWVLINDPGWTLELNGGAVIPTFSDADRPSSADFKRAAGGEQTRREAA